MDSFLSSQRKSLSDCDYAEFRSRLVSSSVDKLLKKSGAAIDAILAAAKDPTAAASPDSPIHLELVNHRLASYPSCSQPLTAHSPPLSASSSSVPSDLLLVGLCLLHQPYITHLPHFLSSYAVLSRYLTNHFLRVGTPGRLVLPLGSFLLHLSSCPSVRRCFTPIHRDFALVSLKSRFYRISSDVLSCPLDRVASSSECPIDDSSEFLEYCYYTGMIKCGNKQFAAASEHFQLALSVPSQTLSLIQLHCFSRLILSRILSEPPPIAQNTSSSSASLTELPARLTSAALLRHLESLCRPYIDLASHYRRCSSVSQFTEFLSSASVMDCLLKDRTFGLAKQVTRKLMKTRIQTLENTYLTVPVNELIRLTGIEQPERELLRFALEPAQMENFPLNARINAKAGTIEFTSSSAADSLDLAAALKEKIAAVQMLSEALRERSAAMDLKQARKAKEKEEKGKSGRAGAARGESFDMLDEQEQMKLAMENSLRQR